jgi:HK97 family phage prohead protease
MKDLRNLPPEVLTRVGDSPLVATTVASSLQEVRLARVELRADGDSATVEGYATIYDYPYHVAGGPPFGWTETIALGAAKRSVAERDDVKLYYNHDGPVLARTKAGTLTLESDDIGLRVAGELDLRREAARDLRFALERGDVDEMSFAFRALRQEWNDDYTTRTITELKLYDVSVVDFPANPATVAQVRGDSKPAERKGMSLSLARAILAA